MRTVPTRTADNARQIFEKGVDASAGINVIRSHGGGRNAARRVLFRVQRRLRIIQRETFSPSNVRRRLARSEAG